MLRRKPWCASAPPRGPPPPLSRCVLTAVAPGFPPTCPPSLCPPPPLRGGDLAPPLGAYVPPCRHPCSRGILSRELPPASLAPGAGGRAGGRVSSPPGARRPRCTGVKRRPCGGTDGRRAPRAGEGGLVK